MKNFFLASIITLSFLTQCTGTTTSKSEPLINGADQPEKYLPLIKDKKVAILANHTSRVGEKHLVDFLVEKNVDIVSVMAPEHGFRGDKDAGEKVYDEVDPKTNIPVFSVYGKKVIEKEIENAEIAIFDIQDVGCRFYTYIYDLLRLQRACAKKGIPLIILDRANPNGDYVAGEILDMNYTSGIGLVPLPVVHGCTIGELAQMYNGEGWLGDNLICNLKIIRNKNYSHDKVFADLPVPPSPNLPNAHSIRLYPSLCIFEATHVSIGRGTPFPFQVIGYPDSTLGDFTFTPVSTPGASKHPKHQDLACYGEDLRKLPSPPKYTLSYFADWYKQIDDDKKYIRNDRAVAIRLGSEKTLQALREGKDLSSLEKSWEKDLDTYKKMRKKYLLYKDFE